MDKIFKTTLSEKAIQYIQDLGQPVANYQFVGYLFPANEEMMGVVSLDGQWGICSRIVNKKGRIKKLKKKKVMNQINEWLSTGFLIVVEETPFQEFNYYPSIEIPDVSKIKYIDGKLFDD